ncbi:MAG TPA: hypothetical protein VEG39_08515 [Clostridia bacterium]|nr:hypothetical protein [Clostridia bacterium]
MLDKFDLVIIELGRKLLYMLPYSAVDIFGMPVGEYAYLLTAIAIIGEAFVMYAGRKVRR